MKPSWMYLYEDWCKKTSQPKGHEAYPDLDVVLKSGPQSDQFVLSDSGDSDSDLWSQYLNAPTDL
jgi:hypothetical protein